MTTEENYLFNCSTNSLPHFSAVLNGLPSQSKNIHFIVNNEGISFITEDGKITLIEVFFEVTLFSTFRLREDHQEIKVSLDLKSLMESLNIASKETNQISMFLKELGDELVLIYQDVKIIERCQLKTYIDTEIESNADLEITADCEWEICVNDGALFFDVLKDFKDLLALNVYLYLNSTGDLYITGITDSSSSIVYKIPTKFVDVINKTNDIIHLKHPQVALVLKMIKSTSKVKIMKSQHVLKFQIFTNQLINSLSSYKDTLINITMLRAEHEFIKKMILRTIAIENEDENVVAQDDHENLNHHMNGLYDDSVFNNSYRAPPLETNLPDHRGLEQQLDDAGYSGRQNNQDNNNFEVPEFL